MRCHNMSQTATLTAKQERFIAALLSSPTQEAACQQIGITRETSRRWLKLPHFQAAYQKAQQALFDERLAALARNMGEDASQSVQVRAAQIWLESAITIHKMSDLEARVIELEQYIKSMRGS